MYEGLTCASLSSGFIFAMCLLFRLAWWFLAADCSWGICTSHSCSWGTSANHSWVNFIFYLFLQVRIAGSLEIHFNTLLFVG
jgi:hypothetical protein